MEIFFFELHFLLSLSIQYIESLKFEIGVLYVDETGALLFHIELVETTEGDGDISRRDEKM